MDKHFDLNKRIQEGINKVNKSIDDMVASELFKIKQNGTEFSSKKEKILQSNIFEKSTDKLLGGALGSATFVKIEGDGNGVLKPYDNYGHVERLRFVNQERAAYLISQFLGFDFIPLTVVKNLKNEEDTTESVASLQEFVEDSKTALEAGNEVDGDIIPRDELIKLAIFDFIIVNYDRHRGNFLIKNNKVYAIDHGGDNTLQLSGVYDEGNYYFYQIAHKDIDAEELPEKLVKLLKSFKKWEQGQNILKEQLSELIEEDVAHGYVQRIISFIDCIKEDKFFDRLKFNEFCKEAAEKYHQDNKISTLELQSVSNIANHTHKLDDPTEHEPYFDEDPYSF